MRFSVEDAIASGLWVALGTLALLSASDYWSTRTFLATSEGVNHAHEVVEQLDHLLAEMTDAETGQRGYLITGSVRYLAPYEQATARIADTLHSIRVLTASDSAQQERLDRLVPEVASRLLLMRETIDLYDREGFEAARQKVLTDRGRRVMDDIRKLVGVMDRAERTVLLDRGSTARTSARLTLVVLLVGDVIAFGLVGSSYVIAMRGLGERRRHVAQVEEGRMRVEGSACPPFALVAEVAELLRPRAAQEGLALEVLYRGPVPETVESDPTRLRQILLNLVGNAIKFTPAGSVRLEVSREEAGPSRRLRFDVVDTGIGLSAEQQARLFTPFSQADTSTARRFGGTGLGLAISKRVAGMRGGALQARSAPGGSSPFTLTIEVGSLDGVRLLDRPPAGPARAPAADQPLSLHGRVLLAEDGLDARRLLARHLR